MLVKLAKCNYFNYSYKEDDNWDETTKPFFSVCIFEKTTNLASNCITFDS